MHSYGKRPAGSDGSDHVHRERIASQYKVSAAYKQTLRILLIIPLFSCTILLCHIIQEDFGIRLTSQVLPALESWEYAYLSTVVLSGIAWFSLRKNRGNLLMFYIIASGLCSVLPLFVAAFVHVPELSLLISQKYTRMFLFGQPFPFILYVFLIFSGLINTYAMYCSSKLVQAWNMKGYKSS